MTAAPVLIVEDDPGLRDALADSLRLAGHQPTTVAGAEGALELVSRKPFSLVVTDLQMSGMNGQRLLVRLRQLRPDLPVVMMTAHGSVAGAVQAMKCGAADYLTKPFEANELVRCVERHLLPAATMPAEGPVADDPASQKLLALVERVAGSDVNVVISGESGTGKEVVARLLHAHSRRSRAPFVAINCAAIPEQMLEATLFGHEKGAYTGAVRAAPGKFEQAQGGTLLLDEVTEMALGLQAKLLRVLQEREVERLGGRTPIKLDLRVVAATNRELAAEVAAGRFREDLFYRLNVFALNTLPLRERPGDILPLAQRFLAAAAVAAGKPVPSLQPTACERLLAHAWPGNVRELDNVMQRALILCSGDAVAEADLPLEVVSVTDCDASGDLSQDLRSREQDRILETLRRVDGCRSEAARRLGLSDRTLRHKLARMRRAGVSVPGDRPPRRPTA